MVLQGVPTFFEKNTADVQMPKPGVPDAADFARTRLGLDLDARQEEVLRSVRAKYSGNLRFAEDCMTVVLAR